MNYYQVDVQYKLFAQNPSEAKEKAKTSLPSNSTLSVTPLQNKQPVLAPRTIYTKLRSVRQSNKEHLVVFYLDVRNQIIKKETVSIGILDTNLVHPREVFQNAISNNASSIIVAHNHPSGTTEPSDADIAVTKRLQECGKLLGIELLDHVIVGKHEYTSLKDQCYI